MIAGAHETMFKLHHVVHAFVVALQTIACGCAPSPSHVITGTLAQASFVMTVGVSLFAAGHSEREDGGPQHPTTHTTAGAQMKATATLTRHQRPGSRSVTHERTGATLSPTLSLLSIRCE